MSALRLVLDALQDAEHEMHQKLAVADHEVTKLRQLLVKHLCDCRRTSLERPLDVNQHRITCTYRREMQDIALLRRQAS